MIDPDVLRLKREKAKKEVELSQRVISVLEKMMASTELTPDENKLVVNSVMRSANLRAQKALASSAFWENDELVQNWLDKKAGIVRHEVGD